MKLLDISDIKKITDAATFEQGERTYQEQKITSVKVIKLAIDDSRLDAVVTENDEDYEQKISIAYNINHQYEVSGHCTCAVDRNCQHVVAVILAYKNHQSSKNISDEEKNWLKQIVDVEVSTLGSDKAEFIAYLLKRDNALKTVSVHFQLTHRLDSGSIAQGRVIQLHSFNNKLMLPDYATTIDMDIAKLLEKLSTDAWEDIPLTGETGYAALKKMLATKHVYWEENAYSALTLGDRRIAELHWLEASNNQVELTLKVSPEAYVIQTSPAWYLDAKTAEVGPMQGASYTPHQWGILEQMPAIDVADVPKYAAQLATMLPGTPNAASAVESVDTVHIKQAPTVNLFLSRKNAGYDQFVHFMRVRLMYDKYEIQPLPKNETSRFSSSTRIIHISRDLTAEQIALDRIKNEGFNGSVADTGGDIEYVSSNSSNTIEVATRWQKFLLDVVPSLKRDGWNIEFDTSFDLQFHSVDDWQVEVEDKNEWFDLRFDLEVNGKKVPLLPLISEILMSYEPDNMPESLVVPIGNNEYINVSSQQVKPICQILYELHDRKTLDAKGKLRLNRSDASRLTELEDTLNDNVQWIGGADLRVLGKKLNDFEGIQIADLPTGLNANLRDYQHQGVNWLQFLREYKFGGILADDMGLGKTIQTLANLLLEKEIGRMKKPCLIIAPTSLMSNWRRESEKFSAALDVLVIHGSDRHHKFDDIPNHDLILTTYPLIARDRESLLAHEYYYLVLDEAQNIKNPNTQAAKIVREIKADYRLCLTGTPMENHLGELWAQLDFLMPGLLGNATFFKRQFRTPIEKHNDDGRRQQLVKRIAPFMLRRKKSEVIEELPDKIEIVRSIVLDKNQAALYESIRLSMEKKVRDAIAKKGLAGNHILVLDALLKLRQTCCDPRLLSIPQAEKVDESAKLDTLMEMLEELLEEGRKILIFSQFTSMLAIIEERMNQSNFAYSKLTGQTKDRDAAIDKFKSGDVNVFLISLKAGGVGLNLTEADTVIHYDPWWNPAAENQATDRAHRIGQDKVVFVYKLITENTVEEKILALQAKKQALMDGVYSKEKDVGNMQLTQEDLEILFSPLEDNT